HRHRALSPATPVIRGTSQNPDVYFQGRETVNRFYDAFPRIVQQTMDRFAVRTGRQYGLFDYYGAVDATKVLILMGSGCETVRETVDHCLHHDKKVGAVMVRLYRPFDTSALLAALPTTVRQIAVLDRTKEPGADGEPLYKDVATALYTNKEHFGTLPDLIGGRYGLSSKEFTPAMVMAILDELDKPTPLNHFAIGIHDDVTNSSLKWDQHFRTDALNTCSQALFYGLGSDGTVSANKNSIKIIGESTDLHAQGYFVYDSKKSGAVTISHLRFGPEPIHSTYLIAENDADYIACHQTQFLDRFDMLGKAADGATFLLNTPACRQTVWDSLPKNVQERLISKKITFFIIDAYQVAQSAGMGSRINTIMQTCFFALSGVIAKDEAIEAIKSTVVKTYGRKSRSIVKLNIRAIDEALENLHQVIVPDVITSEQISGHALPENVPSFINTVTAKLLEGKGDNIPVSQFPVDGTYPTGTACYEKRNLALEIPVWETDICTHCGKCVFVCPHAAIRSKVFAVEATTEAPVTFKHVQIKGKDYPDGSHISYQVAPEDCTGCTLCVDICPIRDKTNASRKALNMAEQKSRLGQEKENWNYFLSLPEPDHREIKRNTLKGSMMMEPLFEFSGACVGCGETPYVRLASQLFGDRMIVANATGCSSIYGGNLPTTPWATNDLGRGPAWCNSLFEDNAEFGLGIRVAVDKQRRHAEELLGDLKELLPQELVETILNNQEGDESEIQLQREQVAVLRENLTQLDDPRAARMVNLAENLMRRSVWIMGGDGWAYDIGFGGLDHVMASGRDVNILVLDTEVYSNTGGQTSKATPRGAVAKYSAAGKTTAKKDLARLAMDYENVYVAHIAYGAKDTQTLHAFLEAESYPGTSLIIAYSPCIAHGVDMRYNHRQQKLAVNSGHWPLFRFDPRRAKDGKNPLHLDSKAPSVEYHEFLKSETRFDMLRRSHPEIAETLATQAAREIHDRYNRYQQLASLDWESSDSNSEDS
ncbi:MAG: pyruvate:ferredoxin (flavodoxin) oxidoreductase, partial [Gammaproteobacteria bacterium]|nr:pyruvate:ferredoxin (flavodoxin) oxidoreductase [Gammaproteobacteria bacterium]